MPIGGAIAHKTPVSPSGAGYDIGCGNKAVLTDAGAADVRANIARIIDDFNGPAIQPRPALPTVAIFSFQLPGLIPSPFRRTAFSRFQLCGADPPGPRGSPRTRSTPRVQILHYRTGRRGRRGALWAGTRGVRPTQRKLPRPSGDFSVANPTYRLSAGGRLGSANQRHFGGKAFRPGTV
jgi:hypothetical protein